MEQHFNEIVWLLVCVSIGAAMIGWEARKAFTAWKKPRQSARPGYIELSGDEYHAVRYTMRSPEDVARRAGAV